MAKNASAYFPCASTDGNALPVSYAVAVLTGIACFNSVELVLLMFISFSRWNTLYFWSLLLASLGVIPHSLGFLLYFFHFTNNYVATTLVTLGWWPMVTGQAVVLYSRLHLISTNKRLLKGILYMIIINAICLHTPTTVLTFLVNGPFDSSSECLVMLPTDGVQVGSLAWGYGVMEKIQMTGFCLQEFFISFVYLRETLALMKLDFSRKSKKLMLHLVLINVIIILMDLALLGIEYSSNYVLETTLKGLVYSVKLRLEFAVLSQLVQYTKPPERGTGDTASLCDEGATLERQASRPSVAQSHVTRPSIALSRFRMRQPFRNTSAATAKNDDLYADYVEDIGPLDPDTRHSGSSSTNRDFDHSERDFAFENNADKIA